MYSRNRIGPKTEHCGAPKLRSALSDFSDFTRMDSDLPARHEQNQLRVVPLLPICCFRVCMSLSWSMVSTAALKSSKTKESMLSNQLHYLDHLDSSTGQFHWYGDGGKQIEKSQWVDVWWDDQSISGTVNKKQILKTCGYFFRFWASMLSVFRSEFTNASLNLSGNVPDTRLTSWLEGACPYALRLF